MDTQNNVVLYQAENGSIAFRADDSVETIWATQKQLSEVFGVDVRTINEHIGNIFSSGELQKNATIRKFRIVQKERDRKVSREIQHYNLDMIISVGYRVNSKVATRFRQWATKTLRQHLTKGYTINEYLLQERKNLYEKVLRDIRELSSGNDLVGPSDVLELVQAFSGTWFSLQKYDEDSLPETGFTPVDIDVHVDELYADIAALKEELIQKKEATKLFAQEVEKQSLAGIFGNVFQSAFGSDAYETLEEKAAHLLYFVVKNHPFVDGNKRTGAFVFVWFLRRADFGFELSITPQALTAITLLIAQSNPKDKQKIVGLVLLLLQKS